MAARSRARVVPARTWRLVLRAAIVGITEETVGAGNRVRVRFELGQFGSRARRFDSGMVCRRRNSVSHGGDGSNGDGQEGRAFGATHARRPARAARSGAMS